MRKIVFLRDVMVLFMVCIVIGGCVKNQQEYEKKLLEQDPSFKKVIAQRDMLRKELASKKETLQTSKQDIDNKISILRKKKTELTKTYAQNVETIKNQINPQKRALKRDLVEYEREYKRITEAVSDADRDLKDINELMEKKETLALSQEEIKTWKDRRATLIDDKQKLEASIIKIKKEIELTKMKIQVLTL